MSQLPASLHVLERGWLSSNNILLFEGDRAILVDTGYVSHAEQTVALVRSALDGRRLTDIVNTHSHSDHIGGNAAVQRACGWAKRAAQASHTRRAGQAWQMAHWLGSHAPRRRRVVCSMEGEGVCMIVSNIGQGATNGCAICLCSCHALRAPAHHRPCCRRPLAGHCACVVALAA